jgi:dTDP-4-amino-4,6-dideoxygalactose transaminase
MSEYSAPTQFIDLAAQQKLIRPQLDAAIKKVLDHGQYIMGPEVAEFEGKLREFTGAKHALTCANGTDALTLVLMAWGIGPGDAVFVPSFTYVATAEAPAQLGATPFFVDVCEDTFNIDPQSFKQAVIDSRELGLRPAVVIAVDLFGQPADVDAMTAIANAENIKVLIDGAQSFGGSSKGRKVGSMGHATTTSFFPAKPLGCYGDGGAVFTSSNEDAEIINSIRLHGKGAQKYDNVRIGLNSRLDTIQAAILIEKLKLFPAELRLRAAVAENYSNSLAGICDVPILHSENVSAWAQFTLKLKNRDVLQAKLKECGIPSVIYYPIALSEQIGYQHYPSVSTGLDNSKSIVGDVLSLPMHPYLLKEQQDIIVKKIKTYLERVLTTV